MKKRRAPTRHFDGTSDFGKALTQRVSRCVLPLGKRVRCAFVDEPVVGTASGRLESPHRSLAGLVDRQIRALVDPAERTDADGTCDTS